MTSPGSAPHLDLDRLADLLAGEGSDADVAHVGDCPGCAGRLDELATADAEVAALLASLPAPPVPADLAERLQAALAGEPPLAPAAAPPSEGPAALGEGAAAAVPARSATVTPFPDAGTRKRRSWLPAAAGVTLLLAGGALGTSLLLSGPDSADETSASAGGGGADSAEVDELSGLTRSETGTDYAADGTLAAALPALLAGSVTPLSAPLAARESGEADAAGELDSPEPAAAPAPVPSGDFSTSAESRAAAPDPALDRLRTADGLAGCLAALLPPDDTSVRPLAVDYAAYQGSPALVVLLPAEDAPDKVDVFVVGAGCTVGDDQTLFFTRLDRP